MREACLEAGYGATQDHNGSAFGGFDLWETIFVHGRRRNAADTYLILARLRANLRVVTEARHPDRDGRARATGVEIERGGRRKVAISRREVVLAAGAFGTPQLLVLSGLGDATTLRALGIACRADLPGVGGNLIDHLATKVGWASATRPRSWPTTAAPAAAPLSCRTCSRAAGARSRWRRRIRAPRRRSIRPTSPTRMTFPRLSLAYGAPSLCREPR